MMMGLILLFVLAVCLPAYANPACAVCTVAVAASLEIARYFGVDDSVVGVWAGALLALLGYWMIVWFDKKNWRFAGRDFWLIALSVAMIGSSGMRTGVAEAVHAAKCLIGRSRCCSFFILILFCSASSPARSF